jgi:luciferase family oxidoreductase group 1
MTAERAYRLSVLDLSPVPSGSSGAEALRNTLDLARLADELGYHRYWLSEHHNTTMLASAAPEILIGYVANATKRIRVGSGGIMLPNHSPLKVAEWFRMLEAFHPGRIDLGVGRAAGTDGRAALALRRAREAPRADDFPDALQDLLGYLTDSLPEGHPFQRLTAIPAGVNPPEIWLLGSTDFGARLAAKLGLGFAFAHHINPEPALESLRQYRAEFQPSKFCQEPAAFIATSVVCAETDEEAAELATSVQLAILQSHQGRKAPVPSVEEAMDYPYQFYERELIESQANRLFIGSPPTVYTQLTALAEQTGVSEIMVTSLIHDHRKRRRCYELLAEVFGASTSPAAP